jgi:hypothetical protein
LTSSGVKQNATVDLLLPSENTSFPHSLFTAQGMWGKGRLNIFCSECKKPADKPRLEIFVSQCQIYYVSPQMYPFSSVDLL